jgi:glutamine synthetase
MYTLEEISTRLSAVKTGVFEMTEARKQANKLEHAEDRAFAYCEKVKPHFDAIRKHVDKLELIVDDEEWPLPKYRELLFLK